MTPGLVRNENTRDQAVQELQRTVQAELERTATTQGRLQQGLQLWNTSLFTDRFVIETQSGVVVGTDLPDVTLSTLDLLPHLRGYKQFLEELSRFNTVGKLRNLRLTVSQVTETLDDVCHGSGLPGHRISPLNLFNGPKGTAHYAGITVTAQHRINVRDHRL